MTTTDVILFESLQYSKTTRIRFYGTDIYENYQNIYRNVSQDLYSDIFRFGVPDNFEIYRDRLSYSLDIALTLIEACRYGNLELVKYLVSLGADLRAWNDEPIVRASISGNLETVKYLVSLGANPRVRDNGPIMVASLNGNLETVKYLVSLGANPKARNDGPIMAASRSGNIGLVQYLVEKCGADPRARNDEPIIDASRFGNYAIADYLRSFQ